MAEKSEVAVLNVLFKNEACHQDMLDIMKYQQNYLGKDYTGTVPSGGIYSCVNGKHARKDSDSDTKLERLELLEPIVEDWHTLMCFLEVSSMAQCFSTCIKQPQ